MASRIRLRLLALLSLCCLLPLGASPADADAPITLRLATFGSPTHPQITHYVPLFTSEVEKNSDGRLKVTHFPAASLVKEPDVASAVPADVADISLVVLEDFAGLDPTLSVLGSPLMNLNFSEFVDRMHPGTPLFKAVDDKLRAHGALLLSAIDIGAPVFDSRVPLRAPSDFSGKNIRVYSPSTAKLVQLLGGSPTQLNQNDVYAALSTGTVQAAYGGVPGTFGAKLYEVGKYIDDPGPMFGSAIMGYVMNLNRFQSLPKDLQAVILAAANKAALSANAANRESYNGFLADMQKHGATIVHLEPQNFRTIIDTLNSQAKAQYPAGDPLVKAVVQAQHR